jgi:hypothetical protein
VLGHAPSTLKELANPRHDSFFTDAPYISDQTTMEGLFVYQAYYDEDEDAFILTVEVHEDTGLTFSNFPNVQGVYEKNGLYSDWEQDGDEMVLQLTPGTHFFVII